KLKIHLQMMMKIFLEMHNPCYLWNVKPIFLLDLLTHLYIVNIMLTFLNRSRMLIGTKVCLRCHDLFLRFYMSKMKYCILNFLLSWAGRH
ncbi:hypothetical protein QYM36_001776, partial [Artemia franciscana]